MLHSIRDAWLAEDAAAVAACFRQDGAFHSPVIGGPGFVGHRAIAGLMDVVFEVSSDTEFTFEIEDGARQIHGFRARFGGRAMTALIQLDLDGAGAIRDLFVFARPLTGVVAVQAAMGPALLERQHRALALPARAGGRLQVGMAAVADRFGRRVARRMSDASRPAEPQRPPPRR